MRLLSSGGEPTFAMLELASGLEVPAREMESPAVRALTEMAICVAALDNDRQSFRREVLRGHTGQNIYTVLVRRHGQSLSEAAVSASALRDLVFHRFLRLMARVRPRGSVELRSYLDGLRHGIRGNAEWGQMVPRYLSRGRLPDPLDDSAGFQWADRPADPAAAPPRVPTIAWWWDDDLC